MTKYIFTVHMDIHIEADSLEAAQEILDEAGPETSLPVTVTHTSYVIHASTIDPFEINREIVFNSNHIPSAEWDLLYGLDIPSVEKVHWGYRIWAPADDRELEELPTLRALLARAVQLDCKWLTLDEDGPMYTQLPLYDW